MSLFILNIAGKYFCLHKYWNISFHHSMAGNYFEGKQKSEHLHRTAVTLLIPAGWNAASFQLDWVNVRRYRSCISTRLPAAIILFIFFSFYIKVWEWSWNPGRPWQCWSSCCFHTHTGTSFSGVVLHSHTDAFLLLQGRPVASIGLQAKPPETCDAGSSSLHSSFL